LIKNRWAILSSIVVSVLLGGFLIYFQMRSNVHNEFLIASTLILLIYGGGLAWALRASGWNPQS
jgi:high-affinity Fe2+/Pb2+ permease